MQVKKVIQSKTIWWNSVLLMALAIIELGAHTFEVFIPPICYAGTLFIASAGNIILRFKTTQPIE